MFKNTFQSGFLSILYSIGSKPLQIWDKKVFSHFGGKFSMFVFLIFFEFSSKVRNGHIKRITDQDIQSLVLEIISSNVSTTYVTCPSDPKKTLGIKLPFLVMIIKNLKKYFTFEVQVRSNVRQCQCEARKNRYFPCSVIVDFPSVATLPIDVATFPLYWHLCICVHDSKTTSLQKCALTT